MSDTWYTLEEVCEVTGKTRNQVSYLIQQKRLRPLNETSWKADGGYQFTEEAVLALLEQEEAKQEREWLTLGEAEQYTGIPKERISYEGRKGERLSRRTEQHGRKKVYLYNRKELDTLKAYIASGEGGNGVATYYNGLVLFDEVITKRGPVRVLDARKRIGLTPSHERIVLPADVTSSIVPEQPYCTKAGYVSFLLPAMQQFRGNVCEAILYLIQHAGYRNVKVQQEEHEYRVTVRLVQIPYYERVYRTLLLSKEEGDMTHDGSTMYFHSYKQRLTVELGKEAHEYLQRLKRQGAIEAYGTFIEELLLQHKQRK